MLELPESSVLGSHPLSLCQEILAWHYRALNICLLNEGVNQNHEDQGAAVFLVNYINVPFGKHGVHDPEPLKDALFQLLRPGRNVGDVLSDREPPSQRSLPSWGSAHPLSI